MTGVYVALNINRGGRYCVSTKKTERTETEIKQKQRVEYGHAVSGEISCDRSYIYWREMPLWILCLSIRRILLIKGTRITPCILLLHLLPGCCFHVVPYKYSVARSAIKSASFNRFSVITNLSAYLKLLNSLELALSLLYSALQIS